MNEIPINTPYPIDGTVYDIDGSTAVNNAIAVALNTTTGERTSGSTNSVGQFILDLANLTSGYSNGDRIQVTVSYGTESGIRSLSIRHTVNVQTGSYSWGSVVLHPGAEPFGTCYITFVSLSSDTTKRTCNYYDRNDNLVFKIDSIADATAVMDFGYLGLKMVGGFIREFSSTTATQAYSVTVFK